MSEEPPARIIAVVGSTGKQGGSVAKHLLEDGTFKVRALTRNKESASASYSYSDVLFKPSLCYPALEQRGAEIVVADLNEPETLNKALEGCYGVFGVTDYWTSLDKEETLGKSLVDAAVKNNIQHFVWSTLDHLEEPETIKHFETKYKVDQYLKTKDTLPRTSIYPSYFFENFGGKLFRLIRNKETRKLELDSFLPTEKEFPAQTASDIGGFVLSVLKNPEEWKGKDLRIVGDRLSPRKFADVFQKLLGEPIEVKVKTEEDWLAARPKVYDELWKNMDWLMNHAWEGRDIDASKEIFPAVKALKDMAPNLLSRVIAPS